MVTMCLEIEMFNPLKRFSGLWVWMILEILIDFFISTLAMCVLFDIIFDIQ